MGEKERHDMEMEIEKKKRWLERETIRFLYGMHYSVY